MALPFESQLFDAAVMALVIFFVANPAKGAAEMARVVRSGGLVAAYAWDVLGGGFPFHPIWEETRAAGVAPQLPPNPSAGDLAALRDLWTAAGLEAVETREIVVERTFPSFEDYWATSTITGECVFHWTECQWQTAANSKRRCAFACPLIPWAASPGERAHTQSRGVSNAKGAEQTVAPRFPGPSLLISDVALKESFRGIADSLYSLGVL
jgi:SAM-dependent methyltransferase